MAQIKGVSLQATGLTCALCSKAINKALLKLPFVDRVDVDLQTSVFTIEVKNEQQINLDDIQRSVEDAGFSIGNLWVTMLFKNDPVQKDSHLLKEGLNLHFLGVKDQLLNGEVKLRMVDRNFVTLREFKKFAAMSSLNCVKTGYMSSCCGKSSKEGVRIYHVTI